MKHEAFQTKKALGLFHREADETVPKGSTKKNTAAVGLDGSLFGTGA